MAGTEQVVLKVERYIKLRDALDQLELSEAKGRMALEEANQRIEQLEEVLNAIHERAEDLAEYNFAMKKIKDMAEEGLQ